MPYDGVDLVWGGGYSGHCQGSWRHWTLWAGEVTMCQRCPRQWDRALVQVCPDVTASGSVWLSGWQMNWHRIWRVHVLSVCLSLSAYLPSDWVAARQTDRQTNSFFSSLWLDLLHNTPNTHLHTCGHTNWPERRMDGQTNGTTVYVIAQH